MCIAQYLLIFKLFNILPQKGNYETKIYEDIWTGQLKMSFVYEKGGITFPQINIINHGEDFYKMCKSFVLH